MNSRHTILCVALIIVLLLAAAANSAPDVQKLLPVKGELAGFDIMPETLVYGKGVNVSKVYNGGYEVYTKNGVIDVAKQMYRRGDAFVEVTGHTMKSAKAATDFINYWAKQRDAKAGTIADTGFGFVVTKPNVMAYYSMDKYFVTVGAFHTQGNPSKDVELFAKAVRKKVKK